MVFLPVRYIFTGNPSFHPFPIRIHLIFELICESAKLCISEIQNHLAVLLMDVLFATIQALQQLGPLTIVFFEETHVLRVICVQRQLSGSLLSV